MTTTSTNRGDTAGSRLLTELATLDFTHASLDAEHIHRIRVIIKQTRAWLKLVRGATAKTPACQRLQDNLRSLSANLSARRDHDVALQTLAKLARKYPGKKAEQVIDALMQGLAQRSLPLPDVQTLSTLSEQICQELVPFIQQVVVPETQIEVVKRTYAQMCKAGKIALTSESCTDLHAWRKQVKTLGYQLQMVAVVGPPLKKLVRHLTKLGSKLGDVHDLCFLQHMIEDPQLTRELDLAPLLKRIAREYKTRINAVRKRNEHVCRLPLQLTGDDEICR